MTEMTEFWIRDYFLNLVHLELGIGNTFTEWIESFYKLDQLQLFFMEFLLQHYLQLLQMYYKDVFSLLPCF